MFNRADGRSTGTTIVAGDQYHIGLGFGHAGCNRDRKSTRLNSSHSQISYAVFCLKKKIALEVAELVHTATLHRRPRPYLANGTAQPRISVDDSEHRRAQATGHQILEAPFPRYCGVTTAQLQGQ